MANNSNTTTAGLWGREHPDQAIRHPSIEKPIYGTSGDMDSKEANYQIQKPRSPLQNAIIMLAICVSFPLH